MMKYQKWHQQIICLNLVVVLLAGCGGSAPAAVSEAPAAVAAPEQAVPTPTSEPATLTPEPPTATPISEPPPVTGGESAIDSLEIGNPERGREIFENGGEKYIDIPQQRCIRCHSLDGSEGYGPSLQGISKWAGDRVPELSAVEYLQQSILDPDAYVVEGFKHMGRIHSVLLNEEEINDLVAFMLTQ
ncbi:MAG TPA: c-type cytochrome [Anaerolineae bacterium]